MLKKSKKSDLKPVAEAVMVGDVWQDLDQRLVAQYKEARLFTVLGVDLRTGKASVESIWKRGIRSRISLRRLRSGPSAKSGYRLVERNGKKV